MIESPCINVCEMDRETRICRGCHRTLGEIACWSQLSDGERRRVMAELPARKEKISFSR
jgi:predicted Fe-S protein YdhL (DUF1289 family)